MNDLKNTGLHIKDSHECKQSLLRDQMTYGNQRKHFIWSGYTHVNSHDNNTATAILSHKFYVNINFMT